MKGFKETLEDKKILISDGAWGTQLAARGLQAGDCPERWNLERPDDVKAVAAGYVEAGSEIILTNTFGGSRVKLEKAGLGDKVAEVNRLGASISKEAAGRAFVFASVGPTGEFMEPLGTITEKEIVACFAEQVKALVAGGADGIVIETMTDLAEAKAALKAVRECCSLPVVVSMTFESGPGGFATIMGVNPVRAAAELDEAGPDLVGSNCGSGIQHMIAVARLMRSSTALPLWVKPNAGVPELVGGKTVFRETPEEMAQHFAELVDAGANVIGGCCGTTPDHISALVAERGSMLKN